MKIKIMLLLAAMGVMFSFARPASRSEETKPATAAMASSTERQPLQPFALEDEDQFK